MTIHWTISHRHRLVMAVARGEVTFADIDGYLTAMATERALPYRKIFDVSHAQDGGMRPEELSSLTRRARHFEADYVLGPVAIIAASPHPHRMAEVYVQKAEAGRPVALFRDLDEARRWIESQPLPFGSQG